MTGRSSSVRRHSRMTQIPGARCSTSTYQGHNVDEPEASQEALRRSRDGTTTGQLLLNISPDRHRRRHQSPSPKFPQRDTPCRPWLWTFPLCRHRRSPCRRTGDRRLLLQRWIFGDAICRLQRGKLNLKNFRNIISLAPLSLEK